MNMLTKPVNEALALYYFHGYSLSEIKAFRNLITKVNEISSQCYVDENAIEQGKSQFFELLSDIPTRGQLLKVPLLNFIHYKLLPCDPLNHLYSEYGFLKFILMSEHTEPLEWLHSSGFDYTNLDVAVVYKLYSQLVLNDEIRQYLLDSWGEANICFDSKIMQKTIAFNSAPQVEKMFSIIDDSSKCDYKQLLSEYAQELDSAKIPDIIVNMSHQTNTKSMIVLKNMLLQQQVDSLDFEHLDFVREQDDNYNNEKALMLTHAVKTNNHQALKQLYDLKFSFENPNQEGYTPLMVALDKCSTVDADDDSMMDDVDEAKEDNILNLDSNNMHGGSDCNRLLNFLLNIEVDNSYQNNKGESAMSLAIRYELTRLLNDNSTTSGYGGLQIVNKLMQNGASFDADKFGYTPLLRLAYEYDGNELAKLWPRLIEAYSHIPTVSYLKSYKDVQQFIAKIKLLERAEEIANGHKVEQPVYPLTAAIYYGFKDVIIHLIAANADVDVPSGYLGITPLKAALLTKKFNIATLLLAKGADMNHLDNRGGDYFSEFSAFENYEAIEFMLKHANLPKAYQMPYTLPDEPEVNNEETEAVINYNLCSGNNAGELMDESLTCETD